MINFDFELFNGGPSALAGSPAIYGCDRNEPFIFCWVVLLCSLMTGLHVLVAMLYGFHRGIAGLIHGSSARCL